MIKTIQASNLKGRSFKMSDLGSKTLLIGPNGSGKTAVRIAATLAVNGNVPGIKTNPDIMAAFASGDKMSVGIAVNGSMLSRQWSTSKTGTSSQKFLVDTHKSSKDKFIEALVSAGNPKIFDLSMFLELSDKKKIDYIFTLYPPAGDVEELEGEIEYHSLAIRAETKRVSDGNSFIAETMAARKSMELPAGTLAAALNDISIAESQLKDARENLSAARDAQIKADTIAAEEEKRKIADAEEAKKLEISKILEAGGPDFMKLHGRAGSGIISHAAALMGDAELKESIDRSAALCNGKPSASATVAVNERFLTGSPDGYKGDPEPGGITPRDSSMYIFAAEDAIETIIWAIKSADCPVCSKSGFALLTARREQARLKQVKEAQNDGN